MTFPTFEDAAAAVDRLRRNAGMWPGIRCRRDGSYTVSLDPAEDES